MESYDIFLFMSVACSLSVMSSGPILVVTCVRTVPFDGLVNVCWIYKVCLFI